MIILYTIQDGSGKDILRGYTPQIGRYGALQTHRSVTIRNPSVKLRGFLSETRSARRIRAAVKAMRRMLPLSLINPMTDEFPLTVIPDPSLTYLI